MPRALPLPPAGLALLLMLSLIWGCNWPIMKIAVSEIPPLVFRTFCLSAGSIGLLTLARLGGHSLRVPRAQVGALMLAAFFNITVWNILIAYGIGMIASARGAILAYTMPLWGVLLSALVLKERVSLRQGFGLAIGLVGLMTLITGELSTDPQSLRGAALILLAAASWGAGTVVVKRARFAVPTVTLAGWLLLLGGLPVYALTPLVDVSAIGPIGLGPVLATLYNMFLAFIFCYWAWFRIVHMVPVAVAAISTLLIPVIGVLSGALILGEAVGLREVMALTLVVAALAAVLLPERRAGPSSAR